MNSELKPKTHSADIQEQLVESILLLLRQLDVAKLKELKTFIEVYIS